LGILLKRVALLYLWGRRFTSEILRGRRESIFLEVSYATSTRQLELFSTQGRPNGTGALAGLAPQDRRAQLGRHQA
jgi:hypothetical protein